MISLFLTNIYYPHSCLYRAFLGQPISYHKLQVIDLYIWEAEHGKACARGAGEFL